MTTTHARSARIATTAAHVDVDTPSDDALIARRLEFMQLDAQGRAAIRSLKSVVDRELPNGLDRFYAQLRTTPEVSRFFSSDEDMGRAKGGQVSHWTNIASASFNPDDAAEVRILGATHACIGLTPQRHLGGYAIVLEHLIVGLVVDGVSDLLSVSSDLVQPLPASIHGEAAGFAHGMITHEIGMICFLDLDRLFPGGGELPLAA